MEQESPDRDDLPELPTAVRRSRMPMWKFVSLVLGLAALAGGLWAWSSRESNTVPNQAVLEATLDTAVAGLVLPEREMSVQKSTCLKPFDACRPAVTAAYRFDAFDQACAAVQQVAARLDVTSRDDEACWVAGYVQGRAVLLAAGGGDSSLDGVPFTVVVI